MHRGHRGVVQGVLRPCRTDTVDVNTHLSCARWGAKQRGGSHPVASERADRPHLSNSRHVDDTFTLLQVACSENTASALRAATPLRVHCVQPHHCIKHEVFICFPYVCSASAVAGLHTAFRIAANRRPLTCICPASAVSSRRPPCPHLGLSRSGAAPALPRGLVVRIRGKADVPEPRDHGQLPHLVVKFLRPRSVALARGS